jgi:hypothetical protein
MDHGRDYQSVRRLELRPRQFWVGAIAFVYGLEVAILLALLDVKLAPTRPREKSGDESGVVTKN